ncbi:MAG: alpha/beta fold hydrolase [Dehalococcoidia bacterium]
MLPTFASGAESWGGAVVRTLADRFLVLRLDWPGIGRSPPFPGGSLSVDAVAQAVLTAAGRHTDAPLRVLGWGLGAMVALRLAADRPERVEHLVLIGGAAHSGALLAAAPTVAALCCVSDTASAEEHMLGFLGRLTSPAWRPFAEMFLVQLLPRPARVLAALQSQWAALPAYDLRSSLDRVRSPTLLLVGDVDALAPPKLARELQASMPSARLHTIAGAGHAAIWEQPGAVLDEVLTFLGGDGDDIETGIPRQRTVVKGRKF